MSSLKILCLLAVLSLAATATANPFSSSSSCPKNWYTNTFGGMSRCCYGHMLVAGAKPDVYCCVHDMVDESTTTSSSGAAPSPTDDSVSSPNSCFSKIPFSASDYSSRVSAASVMAWATTTGPSSNQASSTSTGTSTSTRSASGSGSSTSSGLASSTSNAALPVATAEGAVLGGAAAVIAHFVL